MGAPYLGVHCSTPRNTPMRQDSQPPVQPQNGLQGGWGAQGTSNGCPHVPPWACSPPRAAYSLLCPERSVISSGTEHPCSATQSPQCQGLPGAHRASQQCHTQPWPPVPRARYIPGSLPSPCSELPHIPGSRQAIPVLSAADAPSLQGRPPGPSRRWHGRGARGHRAQ